MAASTPEWLGLHGGELRESKDHHSWLVYLNREPQYLLLPVPVKGQFGCRVTQTVNGKRFDGPDTYASRELALAGGLEQLRKTLGW